ncbi:hypothetical protein GCM10011506_14690 [Marivirga lumbricoides]|uniref:HTH cro/C1-type domain-containing protein n=1 Tax=Marivirga lumbricoides TaxID=1046115 RepID=A0ABQ1LV03_9BACT|nr:hypothetical protein GCM10011506_14690 [Marivirga lumbricoides]
MSKYGENIKKIRSVRGLTQSHLADMIDVSRAVVSSYEEGRAEPKIETIIKTAEIFHISIDTLLKKNITVNQLSGFAIPDIQNPIKSRGSQKKSDYLAGFFPEGVVVLKPEQMEANNYVSGGQLVFGLESKPLKNQLSIVEYKDNFVLGTVHAANEKTIKLEDREIQLQDVKRVLKVFGIFNPVSLIERSENRLLLMEQRLNDLEKRLKLVEKSQK